MPPFAKQQPPRTTCPCKLLPNSLSSFTAAEYGDIHSLSKIKDVATRKDDAGYNPLHFTAQFNHIAATAFLLQLGCPVDGSGDSHCGATPLHRAAFSGATAAMKVLLEWNAPGNSELQTTNSSSTTTTSIPTSAITSSNEKYCDLLARDTSFGDESTPLHKAATGGRYLAVHMILEALKERDTNNITVLAKQQLKRSTLYEQPSPAMPRPSTPWLQRGLLAKDRFGRTPLDVAHHFFKIQDTERDAVARWDAVAGGLADWGKCVRLLENTATAMESKIANEQKQQQAGKADYFSNICQIINTNDDDNNNNNNSRVIPRLPLHLTRGTMACLDCSPVPGENNSVCLTASWQTMFQKALGDSASLCIVARTKSRTVATGTGTDIDIDIDTAMAKAVTTTLRQDTATSSVTINGKNAARNKTNTPKEKASTVHSICTSCGKPTVAFYQLPLVGTLVCKSCRRLAR